MNSALTNIKTITKRELGAYFGSPVAYVFIVIFLLLTGFFTFMISNFIEQGQASLVEFFRWHPWLYLFLVPAVGMRLWSEERRLGTMEFLLTMPITPWQAIVGKFIASWLFLALALLLTFPLVITVKFLGSPDMGVICGAYIGSFLLAGTYLAITSMTSAFTRNQVISFIISVSLCFLLVMAGWPPVINFISGFFPKTDWIVNAIAAFSVMTHFEGFQRGIVDLRDLLFFFSVIVFSLFTTGVILRNLRS